MVSGIRGLLYVLYMSCYAHSVHVCMYFLSLAATNKETIVQAKALQPLISLLSSDSAEVQCNACGCITTLATTGI